jgi:hypothetical protein
LTLAVCADLAVALPEAFRAVTTTRIREPTSADTSVSDLLVAPRIVLQLDLQRSQR